MPRTPEATRCALFLSLLVLLATGFFGFDYLLAGKAFHDVSLPADAQVPLLPGWIWAYLLYYPFCLLPLAMPGFLSDRSEFRRVLAGFLVQFLIAWLLFYFYPTRIERIAVEGASASALALRGLYRVDGGYNVFPSLHVANSFYMAFLAASFWPGWRARAAFAGALLISMSTVLVKQHLVADVPSGLLLAEAGYFVWERLARKASVGITPEQRPLLGRPSPCPTRART